MNAKKTMITRGFLRSFIEDNDSRYDADTAYYVVVPLRPRVLGLRRDTRKRNFSFLENAF